MVLKEPVAWTAQKMHVQSLFWSAPTHTQHAGVYIYIYFSTIPIISRGHHRWQIAALRAHARCTGQRNTRRAAAGARPRRYGNRGSMHVSKPCILSQSRWPAVAAAYSPFLTHSPCAESRASRPRRSFFFFFLRIYREPSAERFTLSAFRRAKRRQRRRRAFASPTISLLLSVPSGLPSSQDGRVTGVHKARLNRARPTISQNQRS